MTQARPQLALLSQEQKHRLHAWSLRILTRPGVRIVATRAREAFGRAIGREIGDDPVPIPPELVTWALSAAPGSVALYDRAGRPAFTLGPAQEGGVRFGIGVTNLYYQEPETDDVVPFTREHMGLATRLGHGLPGYDVISTIGVIQDVPPQVADLVAALEMAANTTKPLVVLTSAAQALPEVLDLLAHLRGDLATRPSVLAYVNPITPLVIDDAAFARIEAAVSRGVPLIYSAYGMAGATTPITAAGALALLNAELLAGLALAQLIRPGTPVILGCLPASFDMRALIGYYGPQTVLLNLACAEMMAHYGLPHCGTSGSGAGWGPDWLAGDLLWMNHLTASLGQVGLAPFVGGNFDSLAFSPAMVVHAEEIIRQARAFAGGFPLDEESAGLDEIARVGPGGDFLTSDLTLRRLREADFRSPIAPRLSLEGWRAAGSPRAEALLRRRTVELLRTLPAPEDQAEMLERGRRFVQAVHHIAIG